MTSTARPARASDWRFSHERSILVGSPPCQFMLVSRGARWCSSLVARRRHGGARGRGVGGRHSAALDVGGRRAADADARPRLDVRRQFVGRAGAGAHVEVPRAHARPARSRQERQDRRGAVLDGPVRARGRGRPCRSRRRAHRARRPQHGHAGHPAVRAALSAARGRARARGRRRRARRAAAPGRAAGAGAGGRTACAGPTARRTARR